MIWYHNFDIDSYNYQYYIARKKGWQFSLSVPYTSRTLAGNPLMIALNIRPRDTQKDIRYNSLWEFPDGFPSVEAAKEFAENWKYDDHKIHCVGADV